MQENFIWLIQKDYYQLFIDLKVESELKLYLNCNYKRIREPKLPEISFPTLIPIFNED